MGGTAESYPIKRTVIDRGGDLLSKRLEGFILDLDGTVYLGERLLPGAAEAISFLREHGKQVKFVTNKPLQPRSVYSKKLTDLGVATHADDIITSGYVMGLYLAKNHPSSRIYVVGEQALREELRSHNLIILDEYKDQHPKSVIVAEEVDIVVVAFDRTLTYRKLNTAYQALVNGALFFATNADKACPMPGGGIPDAGFTLAGLEHICGRPVDVLVGKPSKEMLNTIAHHMQLRPDQCMMIGDRLETDIFMGQQAGMRTAVVLTGASTKSAAQSLSKPPDYILENIGELLS